jgi:hypothetical protein
MVSACAEMDLRDPEKDAHHFSIFYPCHDPAGAARTPIATPIGWRTSSHEVHRAQPS